MSELKLTEFHELPPGLLDVGARRLDSVLPGPSLIHLPGERAQPLFVSVLLHGNETTGLQAVQTVLRRYQSRLLPRALSLFIGNVAAAAEGERRLAGQPDYNRIWPRDAKGQPADESPEALLAAQVVKVMRQREIFASIDVHNNTGRNPHHGAVNMTAPRALALARMFARSVLYFTRPLGVQAMAFMHLCPAVTVECGQVGFSQGVVYAADFLQNCLELNALPDQAPTDIDLYRMQATVTVPEAISLGFGDEPAQIRLSPELDLFNWRELPAGTALARIDDLEGHGFDVRNTKDEDVGAYFLRRSGNKVETAVPLTPAMLTTDERIIRQDCLCYFLERVSYGQVETTR